VEDVMEEKRFVERFNDVFVKTIPIMEDMKKGFFANKLDIVRHNKAQFRELLKSRAASIQKIIEEPNKTEAQKQYLALIPSFQTMGLALENLISKMETKVELKILFSEKALAEIKELYTILEKQFRDTKDYIATKNPVLKEEVKAGWEKIFKLLDEYAIVHQNRLITGVCVPQASYLYLDMVDSIKRISRGLIDFAEKV
jgi:Na+/phosphate symporter